MHTTRAFLIVECSGFLIDVELMPCLSSVLSLVVCELLSWVVGAQGILPIATSAASLWLVLFVIYVACVLRVQLVFGTRVRSVALVLSAASTLPTACGLSIRAISVLLVYFFV